ncbi:hypothetical protein pb186bvf_012055 [Paramecium bursaria]
MDQILNHINKKLKYDVSLWQSYIQTQNIQEAQYELENEVEKFANQNWVLIQKIEGQQQWIQNEINKVKVTLEQNRFSKLQVVIGDNRSRSKGYGIILWQNPIVIQFVVKDKDKNKITLYSGSFKEGRYQGHYQDLQTQERGPFELQSESYLRLDLWDKFVSQKNTKHHLIQKIQHFNQSNWIFEYEQFNEWVPMQLNTFRINDFIKEREATILIIGEDRGFTWKAVGRVHFQEPWSLQLRKVYDDQIQSQQNNATLLYQGELNGDIFEGKWIYIEENMEGKFRLRKV